MASNSNSAHNSISAHSSAHASISRLKSLEINGFKSFAKRIAPRFVIEKWPDFLVTIPSSVSCSRYPEISFGYHLFFRAYSRFSRPYSSDHCSYQAQFRE